MLKRFFSFLLVCCLVFGSAMAQSVVRPSIPNEECARAWTNYNRGKVLWKTGWGLFGGGGAVATAGLVCGVLGAYALNPVVNLCGVGAMFLGCGAMVASVPCLCVGQVKRKSARSIIENIPCDLMAPTCEQLQADYRKANRTWIAGWSLLGSGVGLTALGIGLFYGANNGALSLPCWCVGSAAVISSVPCICVGHTQRKKAMDLINTQCSDQPALTISIQSSANGLGLAMRF